MDNYFRCAGQRVDELLLVSFTDTADQLSAEEALRAAQARAQDAQAEAEADRQQLRELVQQAPIAIALLEEPDHQIAVANPAVRELWGRPDDHLLGRPLLEALYELQGRASIFYWGTC